MLIKACFAVFLSALFLGCTKAAVPSIQALSTTLVEMKVTSSSPFDQNFNTNKYVLFSGQCLTVITNLQIAFNGGSWIDVPTTATSPLNGNDTINGVTYPYTETLNPGTAYDVNCVDGSYSFWLYGHQLDEMIFQALGIAPNTTDINQVALRGVSGSFATSPTIYNSPNNKTATKMSFFKTTPMSGAMAGGCAELVVALKSADNKTANSSVAIPFSIGHTINGTTDSLLMLYQSQNDCSANNTPALVSASSLAIPFNRNDVRFYYRIPGGAAVNDSHYFNINYFNVPVPLDTASANTTFTIKPSTTKYLDIQSPYKILINSCYPVVLNSKQYDGSSYNSTSDIFTVNTATDLEIFSDSTCTSLFPTFMIGGTSKTVYVKLKATAFDGAGFISFNAIGFDNSNSFIEYDVSGDTLVNSVSINGPQNIVVGSNNFFSASQYNKYRTPLMATAIQVIPVNLDYLSKGFYCNSGTCNSGVTSFSIPVGAYKIDVEYKPLLGGPVTLLPGVSGISNYGATTNASGGIVSLAFLSPPSSISSGTCTAITVKTKDAALADYSTGANLTINIAGVFAGELFSNVGCSTGISSTVTVPVSTSSTIFYWKPNSANGIPRTFSATVPGIAAASVNVSIL